MPAFIDPSQIDSLEASSRQDFLLECVSDWFALRERIYGSSPNISFEGAWGVADHVLDRVEHHPQPPGRSVLYALIHSVLQAGASGARPDRLRRGLETYCRALPAHEAGLILFESICDGPPDEVHA
jgi:hypothetical protein